MNALTRTDYQFPGQTKVYHGKVRDCYFINDEYMVMVATDRISAFDVILPKGIPYKGQVLNQIAAMFLDATADIVPNWKLATPHCGAPLQALPHRDDHPRLPHWQLMAYLQERTAHHLRRADP